jgi:small nuclear ribonucleoprotein (snRNP)-like protein
VLVLQEVKAAEARKAKAAALKQRALTAAQRAEAGVHIAPLASIMAKAAEGPLAVLAKWQQSGQRVLVVTRHAAGVRGRAVGTLRAFDRFMNLVLAHVEEQYTVIIKVPREKQQQQQGPDHPGTASCSRAADTDLAGARQQQQQHEQQQQRLQQQQDTQQQVDLQQQSQDLQHLQQALPPISQQQQQCKQGAPGRLRIRWCRKQVQRFRQLDQVLIVGDNIVLVSGDPPAALTADTSKQGQ